MMPNPYNEPDAFGLILVGEHDLTEPFYSFDIGTDSGCSCPSPFENYSGFDDLTGPLTIDQTLEEISSLKGESQYDLAGFNGFIRTIRASEIIQ